MQTALVLKKGPEFGPSHVRDLADSILAHNDLPIVCLSDSKYIDHPGVKTIPLKHGWPGWWSKIELFSHDFGPTLYLDLDTVVIGQIPAIGKRFTMLADVYRDGDFGSGVMSWQKPPRHLYETFLANPKKYMHIYGQRGRGDMWGDQAFIRDNLGMTPDTFGDEYRSYKVSCRKGVPKGTKVVYFHGKPRPWEVTL